MSSPVRRAALYSIAPAFDRAINNRGRLAVVEIESEPLRDCDLLPVESVRHIDHIPIVQISQLRRCPLHVLARRFAVATDMIGIDRRLVPIDVQYNIIERSCARRRECFRDAARRHPAFTFDYVNPRRVLAVNIGRRPGQTK